VNKHPQSLFAAVVPERRLHPAFKRIRDSIEYEPGRTIAEEVFRTFKDPDGNFVEQLQTSGFDARIFELYLHAYFESSGYGISRTRSNPDFILTRQGATVAVEATTSNPSGGAQSLQNFGKRPNPAGITRAERKLAREMPIRLGSPLFSKLKKKYWELPHCKNLPFVIAIEAFHDRFALFFTSSLLDQYLYGLQTSPKWTKEGEMHLEHQVIKEHRVGKKVIPSNFFGQEGAENISAVLFSNSGTWPKFNRLGYEAGYRRGNVMMIRSGTCFDYDPRSAKPVNFVYNLDDLHEKETWGQSLVTFHNPSAKHPLPRGFFKGSVDVHLEKGIITPYVPGYGLLPFASYTQVLRMPDGDLDPAREARAGIRSITLSEFNALGIPRRSELDFLSIEREWFATHDRTVLGTLALDRTDKDWLYAVFRRRPGRKAKFEDVQVSIRKHKAARRRLLDAMEAEMAKLQSKRAADQVRDRRATRLSQKRQEDGPRKVRRVRRPKGS
jgi:hypothetical protein